MALTWKPPGLRQPEKDYRYSTDALLLACFAASFPGRFWCDFGTGCGVIAHILAGRLNASHGFAIERQPGLAAFARENLRRLPVTLVEGDLLHFPWRKRVFDLIACNPPYYRPGAGRINRHPGLAQARHSFFGDICDFGKIALDVLKDDGLFCFIFPYLLYGQPLQALFDMGWHPRVTCLIRSFSGRQPKLVCLALGKGPDPAERVFELSLYSSHRVFTDEAERFFRLGIAPLEGNRNA